MFLERFLISTPFATSVALGAAGMAVCAAGLGYRRLGRGIVVLCVTAIGTGIAAFWFLGILFAASISGRGEGAGVAFLLAGFAAAVGAGLLTLLAGAGWMVWKRDRYFGRTERSPLLLGASVALWAVGAGVAAVQYVNITPALMSSRALLGQASGLNGPLRAEAREELLARGQAAVPAVLEALHKADKSEVKTFESGLNGGILYQLELLGDLGGPEAIAELRAWLIEDYAPDIRATTARALGEAGDTESAHAIAELLELRTYEWRKGHFQLLRALALLKAKDEAQHVRSALQFTEDEEGTSFQTGLLREGIQALAAFDTPEAWKIIEEIANATPQRKEAVARILDEMGKKIPDTAESVSIE